MTEAPALEIRFQPFTAGTPKALQGAHNVAAVDGGRGKGQLFVVVEVHGPAKRRETVAEDLAAILEAAYLEASGGITSALRQAIQAANEHLMGVNDGRTAATRYLAGASCLVLRDGDAYLAQAGPALVYVLSRETLQRYPTQSPWLEGEWPDELDELYMSPLGSRANVPVDLFHYPADLNDRVLMATSALARQLSQAEMAELMEAPSAAGLAEQVCALVDGTEVSGLSLRLAAPDEDEAPLSWETDLAAPASRASDPLTPHPAQESAMPSYHDDYDDLFDLDEAKSAARSGSLARSTGAIVGGLGQVMGGVLRSLVAVLAALLAGMAKLVPVTAAQAGSLLSLWLPRLLPGGEERPYGRPRKPRDLGAHRRYLWLAVAIPVLLGLLVMTTRAQYQRSRERQYAAHMVEAQQKISAAATLSEPASVRDLLQRAEQEVSRALAIKPTSSEGGTLHGQLLAELDDLDRVDRVVPTQLVVLEEGQPQADRILVRGIDLYWLDTGNHRIYKYLLNPERTGLGQPVDNPVLMRKGDERENIVVQDLVDLVWLEPGGDRGRDNLAVLDKAGHLLEYEPSQGVFLVPLVGTDVWRKPLVTAGYRGQLFLLDPNLNQILKYEPTADGYPRPPIYYLNPESAVDLSGALDMAIDADVYVLRADGTVLKFRDGQPLDFRLSGLPEPLQKPVALFTNRGSKSLYVADAGLGAILQFSKEGVFERQFRPPYDGLTLTGLEAVFVDESAARMFFSARNTLYTAALPPYEPPEPAPEGTPGA